MRAGVILAAGLFAIPVFADGNHLASSHEGSGANAAVVFATEDHATSHSDRISSENQDEGFASDPATDSSHGNRGGNGNHFGWGDAGDARAIETSFRGRQGYSSAWGPVPGSSSPGSAAASSTGQNGTDPSMRVPESDSGLLLLLGLGALVGIAALTKK